MGATVRPSSDCAPKASWPCTHTWYACFAHASPCAVSTVRGRNFFKRDLFRLPPTTAVRPASRRSLPLTYRVTKVRR